MNRVEFVKGMNELILGLGDEDLIDIWFMNGVPDSPSDEDFEFIANNQESFNEVLKCFVKLYK